MERWPGLFSCVWLLKMMLLSRRELPFPLNSLDVNPSVVDSKGFLIPVSLAEFKDGFPNPYSCGSCWGVSTGSMVSFREIDKYLHFQSNLTVLSTEKDKMQRYLAEKKK